MSLKDTQENYHKAIYAGFGKPERKRKEKFETLKNKHGKVKASNLADYGNYNEERFLYNGNRIYGFHQPPTYKDHEEAIRTTNIQTLGGLSDVGLFKMKRDIRGSY